jgi:hypothetical protein
MLEAKMNATVATLMLGITLRVLVPLAVVLLLSTLLKVLYSRLEA